MCFVGGTNLTKGAPNSFAFVSAHKEIPYKVNGRTEPGQCKRCLSVLALVHCDRVRFVVDEIRLE